MKHAQMVAKLDKLIVENYEIERNLAVVQYEIGKLEKSVSETREMLRLFRSYIEQEEALERRGKNTVGIYLPENKGTEE